MVAQLVNELKHEVLDDIQAPPMSELYRTLNSEFPVAPIENQAHHQAALAMTERLINFCSIHGEQPDIEKYLNGLSTFIELYEKNLYPVKKPKPSQTLAYLMELHGLRQMDLGRELGGQSIVSELLNEKREFNLKQIRSLSERFHVSPLAFI